MFNKAAMLSRQTSKWLQAAKQPKIERSQSQVICNDILIKNFYKIRMAINVSSYEQICNGFT